MLDRDRKPRLSIELLPEEESLIRRARASAALRGITLRQWVIEALEGKLAAEPSLSLGEAHLRQSPLTGPPGRATQDQRGQSA